MKILPVILAGGSGTRLWPLSRSQFPKQFLSFDGGESLFQSSVKRSQLISDSSKPLVLTNVSLKHLVDQQLSDIGIEAHIILEPEGKNTAAAACLASLIYLKEDGIICLFPSDHAIHEDTAFVGSIEHASRIALGGSIVTLGIKPTGPNTNYGYLDVGLNNSGVYKVNRFIEKPNFKQANKYIDKGNFFWNSGIYVHKPTTIINEFKKFQPEILSICQSSLDNAFHKDNSTYMNEQDFSSCPSLSIDVGISEKSKKIKMVQLDAYWSDLGSWEALHKFQKKDLDGNVLTGNIKLNSSKDNYIHSANKLIVTNNLEETIVVDTPDVLFISSKKNPNFSTLLSEIEQTSPELLETNKKNYRPWGWYDSLDKSSKHQVKRIKVFPNSSLSLQKHFKRSEHWIIIQGSARVTVGDIVKDMSPNESVFIPQGELHRLENITNEVLEIIEVQYGDYLGEDDIVRIEDNYGRAKND